MPFIADDPESFLGQVVNDGQCVSLVKVATGAPHSSEWREGELVKCATDITPGTAIATFFNGVYPNWSHGNHAAIYMGQDEEGIEVIDQWTGQPAHARKIRFDDNESASNNGNLFSVVEA